MVTSALFKRNAHDWPAQASFHPVQTRDIKTQLLSKEFRAFIDTGAKLTAIPRKALGEMRTTQTVKRPILDAFGQSHIVETLLVDLHFLGRLPTVHSLYVAVTEHDYALLGLDYLERAKLKFLLDPCQQQYELHDCKTLPAPNLAPPPKGAR